MLRIVLLTLDDTCGGRCAGQWDAESLSCTSLGEISYRVHNFWWASIIPWLDTSVERVLYYLMYIAFSVLFGNFKLLDAHCADRCLREFKVLIDVAEGRFLHDFLPVEGRTVVRKEMIRVSCVTEFRSSLVNMIIYVNE